ncbi:MAG TPA: 6-carboxyhexanoate--CoA ligase [Nitrospirota bacterium]|nr:6-carboxyhexanoate--CoA ligase [Nitrospirota bacterium]
MPQDLYSVRMRASKAGRHLSGAERIIVPDKIDDVLRAFVARAMERADGPDEVFVKVERLKDGPPRELTALDVVTVNVRDVREGRSAAAVILQKSGVSRSAAETAVRSLAGGPGPSGEIMRGAIIMDAQNGERLEQDRSRGVRVSRFDWSESASVEIDRLLVTAGLTHFRTKEALALATKVAHAPGVVAELCWSDEPDYTAGYAASLKTGYVRFPRLKDPGDTNGGRVFFVDRAVLDLDALMRYLQKEAVLVTATGKCGDAVEPGMNFLHPVGKIEKP